MKWNLSYLPEAKKDMRRLDGREGLLVQKALEKVWTNPLSVHEGLTVPHGNGGKNTDYKRVLTTGRKKTAIGRFHVRWLSFYGQAQPGRFHKLIDFPQDMVHTRLFRRVLLMNQIITLRRITGFVRFGFQTLKKF